MWPSFTSSFSNKEKMKAKLQPTRNLNINDEYLCAVRTKSFADFFIQAQLLVNEQNPTHCHPSFSEILLNPDQETTTSLLESSISSKKPSHQKLLLSNYFNISAEASNLCSHLIKSLNQLQTNYKSINKTINSINPNDEDNSCSTRRLAVGFELMTSDLLRDPFPDLSRQDFRRAQERHSSVLQQLRSKRRRTKRKIKLMKFFNKAFSVCITAACGAAAAAAMFLAVHTLAVLLMGPAALISSVPLKPLKRKMGSFRFFKYGVLRRVVEQLDVAAKGAYILKRDFDTIGRLVERIEDEVEHSRAMMEMCLERREEYGHCLEVLKEVNKYEFGVRKQKQAEELQEHVYLCLLTINRARAMVVREICRTS